MERLFRKNGALRGVTFVRADSSGRRYAALSIAITSADRGSLATQLSVSGLDFFHVYRQAALRVAEHLGISADEGALLKHLKPSAQSFLQAYGLKTRRVSYLQVIDPAHEGDGVRTFDRRPHAGRRAARR